MLNEYKRRSDLIPNLVETVKGYAKQEQSVLFGVTTARAKATQMTIPADILTNKEAFQRFEQNQAQLGNALGRLLAVSEKYPDLKSNENFLACRASSKAPRTASPSRGATTSRRSSNTTPRCARSRAAGSPRSSIPMPR